MHVIEVIVSPQGEVKVTTKGYAGADCLSASQALEQALGARTGEQKTAEFYAGTETAQQQEAPA
jgi:hypothetical protein